MQRLTEEKKQELLNKKVEYIEVGIYDKVRIVAERNDYVLCIIDSALEKGYPYNLFAYKVWSRDCNGGFCWGHDFPDIESAWEDFNERANTRRM